MWFLFRRQPMNENVLMDFYVSRYLMINMRKFLNDQRI